MTTNKQIPADIADDELSAMVAKEHGWYWDQHEYTTRNLTNYWSGMWRRKDNDECGDLPKYATSADCVLPLMGDRSLYGYTINRDNEHGKTWQVILFYNRAPIGGMAAVSSTLPRAICLALLASKGFTITPAKPTEGHK